MVHIKAWNLFSALLTGCILLPQIGQATATDRAAELKIWQEQCNDPDYDLRTAYIEQAITSGDTSIQRVCIRAAVESDNADIKNLGLRAALAASGNLFFTVELPARTKEAFKRAEGNKKAMQKVTNSDENKNYRWARGGIKFAIQNSDINKRISEWNSFAKNTAVDDRCRGEAHVIGAEIKWTGIVFLNKFASCNLNVELAPGAKLQGTLQCEDWLPYPVAANLL